MKKLISLLAAAMLLFGGALAGPKTFDLDTMTLEELTALKVEVQAAIVKAYAASGDAAFPATREQPAPIGAAVRYDGSSYYNEAVTDLTVLEVIRGEKALAIVRAWESYNPRPAADEEYIIVRIRAKAVAAPEGTQGEVYDYDFTFISADGTEYEYAYAAGMDDELGAMYEGGSCEGYAVCLVKKGDAPLMVYLKNADKPLWFDLNRYAPVIIDETEPLTALKRGDINEDVRTMQRALIEMGYLNDVADGNFGRNTEAAVKSYQAAMGMDVTGIADDATLRLILTHAKPE